MCENPLWRSALLLLLVVALLLPVVICVVLGVGFLLQSLGDVAGSAVLGRIALALGIVWILDLIFLLVVQAVGHLLDRQPK